MSWSRADVPDLTGRVTVVTGANGGLGLETAEALAVAGAHVVLAARTPSKTEAALTRIRQAAPHASLKVVALDLSAQHSVHEAAETILAAHGRIDLLVNNAGVMAVPEEMTEDGFETHLAVNHLGHFALTGLLLPGLLAAKAARVVTVTSIARLTARVLDPANPNLSGTYTPYGAYNQSKLANFHFGQGLQRRFESARVSAASVLAHPGVTRTELLPGTLGEATPTFNGPRQWLTSATTMTPANGARSQLRASTDPAARGGDLYGPALGNVGPPVRKPILRRFRLGQDIDTLWQFSEDVTGVHYSV